MSYFLKKTTNKKGIYLQIYESYYDQNRGYAAHKSYKPIGYLHELIEKGIKDPISFYKEEINKLNNQTKIEKNKNKIKLIDKETPEKLLGYLPLKIINDSLGVKKYIDLFQTINNYKFNIFDMMSSLIYARLIQPCSKSKTYEEVIPKLLTEHNYSLNQLYSGLEFIGNEYEKIIEIYNHQIQQNYKFNTKHTYFDCTNFYFEIDKEDDFRKKGPSKENRKEPIVSLGLLLDANQIPIGMKLFPGSDSEKPILRDVIKDLKSRNSITGRIIHIADKGLNCADNIFNSLKNGDGYIFSKSIKQLPEKEIKWAMLQNGFQDVLDENGELIYKYKECIDDFEYKVFNKDKNKMSVIKVREKRIITYNPKLAKKQILEIKKEIEKAHLLKMSQAKRSEFGDCSKYIIFKTDSNDKIDNKGKITLLMNDKVIEKSLSLAGYKMLVTSEIKMKSDEIYNAYHNLWRIEESFKVMKSQLDARPVYLQKQETITGHFLICYLSVVLTRIFQFKILKNNFSTEQIFEFIKKFKVVKISENNYLNLTRDSEFINYLCQTTCLNFNTYYISKGDIKKMLNYRFKI